MTLTSAKTTTSGSAVATGAAASTEAKSRQIVRDSGGNLVALVQTSSSAVTPFISTDDGSSWTKGDTTMTADSADAVDCAIDANDNIGMTSQATANNTDALYNEFTITTSGAVTKNVTDETILSVNTRITDTAIVRDGTNNSWWMSVQFGNKNMGTTYDNLRLYERSGGTYTSHTDYGSGTTNHGRPTMAMDSAGDVRLVWDKGGSTVWNKWDASAASLVGQETVVASAYDGQLTIDSGNSYVTVGNTLYERSGGTWASDQYTSKTVAVSTVEPSGGELFVTFESGGDIYYNNQTFGSFTTGSDSTLQSGANTYQEPSSRWQFNNDNEPATATADVLYYDNTNGDVFYGRIQGLQTQAATEVATIDEFTLSFKMKILAVAVTVAAVTSFFLPGYFLRATYPTLSVSTPRDETATADETSIVSKIVGMPVAALTETVSATETALTSVLGIDAAILTAVVATTTTDQRGVTTTAATVAATVSAFARTAAFLRALRVAVGSRPTLVTQARFPRTFSSTLAAHSTRRVGVRRRLPESVAMVPVQVRHGDVAARLAETAGVVETTTRGVAQRSRAAVTVQTTPATVSAYHRAYSAVVGVLDDAQPASKTLVAMAETVSLAVTRGGAATLTRTFAPVVATTVRRTLAPTLAATVVSATRATSADTVTGHRALAPTVSATATTTRAVTKPATTTITDTSSLTSVLRGHRPLTAVASVTDRVPRRSAKLLSARPATTTVLSTVVRGRRSLSAVASVTSQLARRSTTTRTVLVATVGTGAERLRGRRVVVAATAVRTGFRRHVRKPAAVIATVAGVSRWRATLDHSLRVATTAASRRSVVKRLVTVSGVSGLFARRSELVRSFTPLLATSGTRRLSARAVKPVTVASQAALTRVVTATRTLTEVPSTTAHVFASAGELLRLAVTVATDATQPRRATLHRTFDALVSSQSLVRRVTTTGRQTTVATRVARQSRVRHAVASVVGVIARRRTLTATARAVTSAVHGTATRRAALRRGLAAVVSTVEAVSPTAAGLKRRVPTATVALAETTTQTGTFQRVAATVSATVARPHPHGAFGTVASAVVAATATLGRGVTTRRSETMTAVARFVRIATVTRTFDGVVSVTAGVAASANQARQAISTALVSTRASSPRGVSRPQQAVMAATTRISRTTGVVRSVAVATQTTRQAGVRIGHRAVVAVAVTPARVVGQFAVVTVATSPVFDRIATVHRTLEPVVGAVAVVGLDIPVQRVSEIGRNVVVVGRSQRGAAVTASVRAAVTAVGVVAATLESAGRRVADVAPSKNEGDDE